MLTLSPFWICPCSRMAKQVPTGISPGLWQRSQEKKQQPHSTAKTRYSLFSPALAGSDSNDWSKKIYSKVIKSRHRGDLVAHMTRMSWFMLIRHTSIIYQFSQTVNKTSSLPFQSLNLVLVRDIVLHQSTHILKTSHGTTIFTMFIKQLLW